jgi:hypothetical protein
MDVHPEIVPAELSLAFLHCDDLLLKERSDGGIEWA